MEDTYKRFIYAFTGLTTDEYARKILHNFENDQTNSISSEVDNVNDNVV